MCDFLSFGVNTSVLEGEPLVVYIGDGESHCGIERGWGLKPGEYAECEWTRDAPYWLKVRAEAALAGKAITAAILAVYPTRDALFAALKDGRTVGGTTRCRVRFRFVRGELRSTIYRWSPPCHAIIRRNGQFWCGPDQEYLQRQRRWAEYRPLKNGGESEHRCRARNLRARIKRHCKPLMDL